MDNSATISSQLSIVNCQLGVLKSYFPTLTDAQKQQIDALFDLYSDWNSKINVISRKDIENLYLHHVLHSLGILKMLKFREGSTIMDIGTGGGFPGIPLAILLPEVQFHLVDSIGKKIKVGQAVARSDRSEKRHFPPLSCRRGKTIIRLCRESCRHATGRSGKNRP